jgi:hypothetical protein
MIYYLGLRFRAKAASKPGLLDHFGQPVTRTRFREIIYRTVECNLLSLIAQTATIGLFNSPSVGLYFGAANGPIARIELTLFQLCPI